MSDDGKEIVPIERPRREIAVVQHPIPIFDSARFEHFQRIALLMARASLMPKHLKVFIKGDDGPIDVESTLGNCLLVVNQAEKWRMDPFSLAQATFRTPGGQIGYEGKAVAAALKSTIGVELDYEFFGKEVTDDRGVIARGVRPGTGKVEEAKGTVGQWKTKNRDGTVKSNWLNQPDDQLIYRSTRQWARRWAPEVIMGVVTDDEIDDMLEYQRAMRATPVGPSLAARLQKPNAGTGFSLEHVEREINGTDGCQANAGVIEATNEGCPSQVSGGMEPPASRLATGRTVDPTSSSAVIDDASNVGQLDREESVDATAGETALESNTEAQRAAKAEPNLGISTESAPRDDLPAFERASLNSDAGAATGHVGDPPPQSNTRASVEGNAPGATEGRGAEPSTSPPLPPAFGNYHLALARATQEKSLRSLDTAFRTRNAWTTDGRHLKTMRGIYLVHLKKLRGEIKPQQLADELGRLGALS